MLIKHNLLIINKMLLFWFIAYGWSGVNGGVASKIWWHSKIFRSHFASQMCVFYIICASSLDFIITFFWHKQPYFLFYSIQSGFMHAYCLYHPTFLLRHSKMQTSILTHSQQNHEADGLQKTTLGTTPISQKQEFIETGQLKICKKKKKPLFILQLFGSLCSLVASDTCSLLIGYQGHMLYLHAQERVSSYDLLTPILNPAGCVCLLLVCHSVWRLIKKSQTRGGDQ